MLRETVIAWGLGFFLVIITVLTYSEAFNFGFVPYDDPAYVTQNGYINQGLTLEGLQWASTYREGSRELLHHGAANLWHPATWISHMLDVEMFGLDGPGHHATSILLHAANGLLVFFTFRALFSKSLSAFLLALLFLVHPLRVESVAWVSERKDVLSGTFFWAATLMAVLRWEQKVKLRRQLSLAVGLILFACALLSKPSVVVLPALLLVLEGWKNGERDWSFSFWMKGLRSWSVWLILAFLVSLVAITLQREGSHSYFAAQTTLLSRLQSFPAALAFYLWRTVIPVNLSIDYPAPQVGLAVHLVGWLLFLTLVVLIWQRRAKNPDLFFASLWFLLCLLPVSGIFYVGTSFTLDRYLYLALLGPLLLLTKSLLRLPWGTPLLLIIAAGWTFLSIQQVSVWRDGWTLFRHTTKAQPRSTVGWSNLGSMHQEADQLLEARQAYERALAIFPFDHISHYNLGIILTKMERPEQAEESYRQALSIDPEYLSAIKNLGLLLRGSGKKEESLFYFEKGVLLSRQQDPVFLWLACETNLLLENYQAAEEKLQILEKMPVSHPSILTQIAKAREFLESKARAQ